MDRQCGRHGACRAGHCFCSLAYQGPTCDTPRALPQGLAGRRKGATGAAVTSATYDVRARCALFCFWRTPPFSLRSLPRLLCPGL